MRVLDAFGVILFTDDKKIVNLLPEATVSLASVWNTGLYPPGAYDVVVETYLDGNLIVSRSAQFKIAEEITIMGAVTVTPSVVLAGKTADIGYTIQIAGNAFVENLPVTLFVIDPETQDILVSYSDSYSNTSVSAVKAKAAASRYTVPTQGYALKTYIAVLKCIYGGKPLILATDSFVVKDGTPPFLDILSPSDGSWTREASLNVMGTVSDGGSGVKGVSINGNAVTVVGDLFSATVRLTVGANEITVAAFDNAGNTTSDTRTVILVGPTTVAVEAATGNGTITLATDTDGCWFSYVRTKTKEQSNIDDPLYSYPYGLVEFGLNCSPPGVSADVSIAFPENIGGMKYRKYGPTIPGDDTTAGWYTFNGATISGDIALLHLTDGQLGDDTGLDGIIVDQGGPGQPSKDPVAIPAMTGWGVGVYALLALLGGFFSLKKRRKT